MYLMFYLIQTQTTVHTNMHLETDVNSWLVVLDFHPKTSTFEIENMMDN